MKISPTRDADDNDNVPVEKHRPSHELMIIESDIAQLTSPSAALIDDQRFPLENLRVFNDPSPRGTARCDNFDLQCAPKVAQPLHEAQSESRHLWKRICCTCMHASRLDALRSRTRQYSIWHHRQLKARPPARR